MYETFYGLNSRPFQLTPDPHYYFESLTHRKALSYLGYGLAQGEGFIVITGDVGAGKTTLVSHLMATIDRARLTAGSIVTTRLDSKDIVRVAATNFDIDTKGMDKAQLLSAFEEFLHSEARAGRRCLLIVDEAQNLPTDSLEELRMLSNFQLGGQALLQIFLLGQPEFRDMLQQSDRLEQLRQRVIAHHHLDPMESQEVEPYIMHRLTKSGWAGRPQITSDIFSLLFDETGGVPRKINTLMSRVMLMGAVEQAELIDLSLVRRVLADLKGEEVEIADPDAAAGRVTEERPVWENSNRDVSVKEQPQTQVEGHSEPVSEKREETISSPNAEAESNHRLLAHIDMMTSKLAALESRLDNHEESVHRVLSMLVEWVENDIRSKESYVNAGRAA
ncbi:XrtA/PEP-CTERM system-associated ATPase [Parasphingorhabdus sp.]|uniref:XrtA/PEP-CTERM system-associated ATPase n=1 Tax=Parasphingorhabdus sp. TaxID=2709688 RepID=UPI002F91EEF4